MFACCTYSEKTLVQRTFTFKIDPSLIHNSMSLWSSISETHYDLLKKNKIGPYQSNYKNEKTISFWNNAAKEDKSDRYSTGLYEVKQLTLSKQSSQSTQGSQSQSVKQEQKNPRFITSAEDSKVYQIYQFNKFNSEFLAQVVYGPPPEKRWPCWKILLLDEKPYFYERFRYERQLVQECVNSKNISKDKERTLVNHTLFSQNESILAQNYLSRVLSAISETVPNLGYCQGMNYIVGLVLIISGCDEFYTYSTVLSLLLSQEHLLYFLYVDGVALHFLYCELIHQKIKDHFPSFDQYLQQNHIEDSNWLTKMIMTLFLYNFKFEDCLRAWDYIIARGALRAIPELILGLISLQIDVLISNRSEKFSEMFSQGHIIEIDMDELLARTLHFKIKRNEIVKSSAILNKRKQCQQLDKLLRYYSKEDKFNDKVKKFVLKEIH